MVINEILADLKNLFGNSRTVPTTSSPSVISECNDALCFIVEDEPEIAQVIAKVLKAAGLQVEVYGSVSGLMKGLARHHPKLMFLDVSLEKSDAVEAVHGLARLNYRGDISLMSGRHGQLLDDIRKVGERHGLRMLQALYKPFDLATIRGIVRDSFGQTRSVKVPPIGIDEALTKGWMKIWYQPKIDLKKRMLVGCEALARIEHPEHGIISPGAFIPGASRESMTRLTEHVLLTVLRDSERFMNEAVSLKPAVNVPVDVLLNFPIAALVRENRPKGDAWKGLLLEVTEDQILKDIKRAQDITTQLKIYDMSLSIDDFGAGYSSFSRLKHLPFAEFKLDMSFVKDCAKNAQNAAICKAVIDLAHSFEAVAVAEGIEYADDLRALYQMGCDLGQGFLLARPMPLDDFIATLAKRRADRVKAENLAIQG